MAFNSSFVLWTRSHQTNHISWSFFQHLYFRILYQVPEPTFFVNGALGRVMVGPLVWTLWFFPHYVTKIFFAIIAFFILTVERIVLVFVFQFAIVWQPHLFKHHRHYFYMLNLTYWIEPVEMFVKNWMGKTGLSQILSHHLLLRSWVGYS